MLDPLRRVVAGLDAAGRSAILSDGASLPVVWSEPVRPAAAGIAGDQGGRTCALH